MTSQFNPDAILNVDFDTRDAGIELDRLRRGLDELTRKRLAAALERYFQQTQRDVHVLSGALKASGKRRIRDSAHHWEGHISYGGKTPVRRLRQKNRPYYVDYAEIENNYEGVRTEPKRRSRRKNSKPGAQERSSDYNKIDPASYGTPHQFFDDAEITALFNEITQDVLDWLASQALKRQKGREYRARKAAAEGRTYKPRNT